MIGSGQMGKSGVKPEQPRVEQEGFQEKSAPDSLGLEAEKGLEQGEEKESNPGQGRSEEDFSEKAAYYAGPVQQAPAPSVQKSPVQLEIENILSENIEGLYLNLPESVQFQFKKKGEETARQIEVIISQAKFKVKKILDLIKIWLKMLPGVNKFFLEQEAKIKTDKILKLKQK